MPRRYKTLSLVLLACLAILSVAGCDNQKSYKPDGSSLGDTARRPDSELRGAQISLYQGKNLTTGIQADKILKFEAQDSAVAYRLTIQFYDSTGKVVSNLVGDSGVVRELKGLFEIYGNVVGKSVDQDVTLKTDYLKWNPEVNRVQTDAFITLSKGNDVHTGYGFEADRGFSHIKILREVSGTVSESTAVIK
jgi:LPS export ABC transporter protein LptC